MNSNPPDLCTLTIVALTLLGLALYFSKTLRQSLAEAAGDVLKAWFIKCMKFLIPMVGIGLAIAYLWNSLGL